MAKKKKDKKEDKKDKKDKKKKDKAKAENKKPPLPKVVITPGPGELKKPINVTLKFGEDNVVIVLYCLASDPRLSLARGSPAP